MASFIACVIKPLVRLCVVFACLELISAQSSLRIGCIGDFGSRDGGEYVVSRLVQSWDSADPLDFVISLGDNNYFSGDADVMDASVGKYYGKFIGNYSGRAGGMLGPAGPTDINRFFPCPGNHDWGNLQGSRQNLSPYLDYFSKIKVPVPITYYYRYDQGKHPLAPADHPWPLAIFFSLDSQLYLQNSTMFYKQQAWFFHQLNAINTAEKLLNVTAWKIVYFHHPPYSSGNHGSNTFMQWPFYLGGIDVVLAGHDHHYERIVPDNSGGIPYFVNGVSGAFLNGIEGNTRFIPGSQIHYGYRLGASGQRLNTFGAQIIEINADRLSLTFISTLDTFNDSYVTQRHNVAAPFQWILSEWSTCLSATCPADIGRQRRTAVCLQEETANAAPEGFESLCGVKPDISRDCANPCTTSTTSTTSIPSSSSSSPSTSTPRPDTAVSSSTSAPPSTSLASLNNSMATLGGSDASFAPSGVFSSSFSSGGIFFLITLLVLAFLLLWWFCFRRLCPAFCRSARDFPPHRFAPLATEPDNHRELDKAEGETPRLPTEQFEHGAADAVPLKRVQTNELEDSSEKL